MRRMKWKIIRWRENNIEKDYDIENNIEEENKKNNNIIIMKY